MADAVVGTGTPVRIGPFSADEARLLLRKLEKKTNSPDSIINKILGLLGHIPLAITQAAACINRSGGDLQQYLLLFEQSESVGSCS